MYLKRRLIGYSETSLINAGQPMCLLATVSQLTFFAVLVVCLFCCYSIRRRPIQGRQV